MENLKERAVQAAERFPYRRGDRHCGARRG